MKIPGTIGTSNLAPTSLSIQSLMKSTSSRLCHKIVTRIDVDKLNIRHEILLT